MSGNGKDPVGKAIDAEAAKAAPQVRRVQARLAMSNDRIALLDVPLPLSPIDVVMIEDGLHQLMREIAARNPVSRIVLPT